MGLWSCSKLSIGTGVTLLFLVYDIGDVSTGSWRPRRR